MQADIVAFEKETEYLWWLGSSLTQAVQTGDRVRAEELAHALGLIAEASEHPANRLKANQILYPACLVGPSDLVAFKVAEATVSADQTAARRSMPILPALLAAVVASCSLAASPSMTDPPSWPVYEMAVVDESNVCAEWVDRCE